MYAAQCGRSIRDIKCLGCCKCKSKYVILVCPLKRPAKYLRRLWPVLVQTYLFKPIGEFSLQLQVFSLITENSGLKWIFGIGIQELAIFFYSNTVDVFFSCAVVLQKGKLLKPWPADNYRYRYRSWAESLSYTTIEPNSTALEKNTPS